jgi:hypothetical protein
MMKLIFNHAAKEKNRQTAALRLPKKAWLCIAYLHRQERAYALSLVMPRRLPYISSLERIRETKSR